VWSSSEQRTTSTNHRTSINNLERLFRKRHDRYALVPPVQRQSERHARQRNCSRRTGYHPPRHPRGTAQHRLEDPGAGHPFDHQTGEPIELTYLPLVINSHQPPDHEETIWHPRRRSNDPDLVLPVPLINIPFAPHRPGRLEHTPSSHPIHPAETDLDRLFIVP
jgi:hypothetical protein